jgi:hypothetical protein
MPRAANLIKSTQRDCESKINALLGKCKAPVNFRAKWRVLLRTRDGLRCGGKDANGLAEFDIP